MLSLMIHHEAHADHDLLCRAEAPLFLWSTTCESGSLPIDRITVLTLRFLDVESDSSTTSLPEREVRPPQSTSFARATTPSSSSTVNTRSNPFHVTTVTVRTRSSTCSRS